MENLENIIANNDGTINVEEVLDEVITATADNTTQSEQNALLTPEEFEKYFFEFFGLVGEFWKIDGFAIDVNKPFEVAGAKVSAKKLYSMAERYKMLHFLIEPTGGWFGDFIMVGIFAYAKADALSRKIGGLTLGGRVKRVFKRLFKLKQSEPEKSGFFPFLKGKANEERA